MPKQVQAGAQLSTDTGELKGAETGFDFLQNVSGFGSHIAKRKAVTHKVTVPSGIMGIFDLLNDGDPKSPDKILVIGAAGIWYTYNWSEIQ